MNLVIVDSPHQDVPLAQNMERALDKVDLLVISCNAGNPSWVLGFGSFFPTPNLQLQNIYIYIYIY